MTRGPLHGFGLAVFRRGEWVRLSRQSRPDPPPGVEAQHQRGEQKEAAEARGFAFSLGFAGPG